MFYLFYSCYLCCEDYQCQAIIFGIAAGGQGGKTERSGQCVKRQCCHAHKDCSSGEKEFCFTQQEVRRTERKSTIISDSYFVQKFLWFSCA